MGLFNRNKPHKGTPSTPQGGPGMLTQVDLGYNPGFYLDNPQWYPGENVNVHGKKPVLIRNALTVTDGINEDENQQARLHYTNRPQPDIGGALNFSYDLYALPLNDVCGPFMVATNPTKPMGSPPTAFFQEAALTSIGGLIPGQFIHQPLLDPNAPGSGYDYIGW